MPNLVHVTYDQTGKSKSTNATGMIQNPNVDNSNYKEVCSTFNIED